MRLFLDACVWGGAKHALSEQGHDVRWAGDGAAGQSDSDLLAWAVAEERVFITLDKDFGELVVSLGAAHLGIVRLVGVSAREQGVVAQQVLARFAPEVAECAIITVEPGRVRIRRTIPPKRSGETETHEKAQGRPPSP